MPHGRVKFIVRPTSAENFAQFRANVEAQLATKPVHRRDIDWTFSSEDRQWVLDIRFDTPAAATAFRRWFEDNLTQIRQWVNGVVQAHLCSHDDAEVYSCKDDPRSQYREVRL